MNYTELRRLAPSAHTTDVNPRSLSLTRPTAPEERLPSAEHVRAIYALTLLL